MKRRQTDNWITVVLVLLGLASVTLRAAPGELQARFAEAPREGRILKIIHGWPDDAAEQDAWRDSLLRQGFGGVVCNVSFQDYLQSEARWQAFHRAVVKAREAGLVLWLYDERGYPSGTAGGGVLRDHPEWQARGLLIQDLDVAGDEEVRWPLPPGHLRQLLAYPVEDLSGPTLRRGVDLRDRVSDGTLSWQVPKGDWHLLAVTESPLYEGTHAAMNLDAKLPYPNLLSLGPTRRFLELTHAAYARRFATSLGDWFEATFTDEPSLMSLFFRSMPYAVLPWDEELSTDYRKRFGRSLDVASLVLDDTADGKRARFEFWQLVSGRVAENFFGEIQAWCGRENLRSGGHLLMEENLTAQVPLYGDFFACLRRLDAPGIDCLTSLPPEVPWRIARLAQSAAVLEGRERTMSETSDHSQRYRPEGDLRAQVTVTESQIRGTLNRLMAGGINTFTSYYSFAGLSDEALRRLNDYVGRCTLLLREGQPAADIAVLWPVESLWARTLPGRGLVSPSPGAGMIEQTFNEACEQLFASRREFLCIDSRTVLESEPSSGGLRYRDQRWSVVVLPGVDTLPEAAWERLEDFVKQGGVVIALGSAPANTDREFPSAGVALLADRVFGPLGPEATMRRHPSGGLGLFLPAGCVGFLAELLDQLRQPVLRVESADAPLRLASRRWEKGHRLFLINDSQQGWKGRVVTESLREVECWNPATGTVERGDGTGVWELDLEPYGAVFLCGQEQSERAAPLDRELVLPSWNRHLLSVRAPAVGRGEFVRELVEEQRGDDWAEGRSWRASGRLTRGQVDTFLFLMFPLEDGGHDLSTGSCLVLDSRVPEGQRTASQLLVILKESGGAEYLASTGRSLGLPGRQRTHLFWSQFQLAGWSRDENARLDLDQISEVRVGWGGYFGAAEESVEFTVSQPALGTRGRGR